MVTRHVERRLDDDLAIVGAVHEDLQRFDVGPGEAALDGCRQPGMVVATRLIDQMGVDELAPGEIEHRQCRGVGRQHDTISVDEQHRLGQFVEQAPHLRLGGLHRGDAAVHALVLAAQVPHAERERDDGDAADDHHHLVSAQVHVTRLRQHASVRPGIRRTVPGTDTTHEPTSRCARPGASDVREGCLHEQIDPNATTCTAGTEPHVRGQAP